jgi:DNA-binding response OmpR family regulator
MAAILIIGDDPMLLETRADLLRNWRVATATSQDAAESIRSNARDLIIFCQTIPDVAVEELIRRAREINPHVLVLAMSHIGQERNVDAELYEVQLTDPDRLRRTVARILPTSSTH